MVTIRYNFNTFDPRIGEDYLYRLGKKEFSSRLNKMFVLDIWPKQFLASRGAKSATLSPSWLDDVLVDAMRATSSLGFFTIYPITAKAERAARAPLKSAHRILESCLGYFQPGEVNDYFELRDDLQTYDAWAIGGCTSQFHLPSGPVPRFLMPEMFDFEYVLGQPERLGCLLYRNGETGEQILVTRIFDTLDGHLSNLYGQVP